MTQPKQFLAESQKRLEEFTREGIAQILEWTWADVETLCESKIEKLFLLAWVEKLEEYRLMGWFRGWTSRYYIVGSLISPRIPLGTILQEKPFQHLIESDFGFDQVDLVYPQQVIGDYRVDFVLA